MFHQQYTTLLFSTKICQVEVSNVLRRHSELTERLSRDSDKMIFERLQKEFEAARAAQTQGVIILRLPSWSPSSSSSSSLNACANKKQLPVHMEVERKAMQGDANILPAKTINAAHDASTSDCYWSFGVRDSVLMSPINVFTQIVRPFGLAILYCPHGEPCELYHCVLESKSFLEKMTVLEHTVPFFLPIREAENDLLSSNAMVWLVVWNIFAGLLITKYAQPNISTVLFQKFIDHVGDLLQAYVDRREQVRLIKELYGNQIGELYHSLPYHMIEFVLDDFDCKVTVSLRYADLISVLPTRISVLVWPMHQSKKSATSTVTATMSKKGDGVSGSHSIPARLSYAEDALRTMSLPEDKTSIMQIGNQYLLFEAFSICGDCVESASSASTIVSTQELFIVLNLFLASKMQTGLVQRNNKDGS
ncbi:hypothetical protein TEA_018464 [Camellia sinensis var. sinensis]|uniref:Uncharacterized protein n=1 Tax=Camellia sinensis var. sinensis TaxID=542762 RepID=A0A4S4CZG9_CAMSN|nr:hypothetical protein TEA_018464 [Camellia sinensis var. sinensis]